MKYVVDYIMYDVPILTVPICTIILLRKIRYKYKYT